MDIRDDKVEYYRSILLPFVIVIYITNSKVHALGMSHNLWVNALSERCDHCNNFDLI